MSSLSVLRYLDNFRNSEYRLSFGEYGHNKAKAYGRSKGGKDVKNSKDGRDGKDGKDGKDTSNCKPLMAATLSTKRTISRFMWL